MKLYYVPINKWSKELQELGNQIRKALSSEEEKIFDNFEYKGEYYIYLEYNPEYDCHYLQVLSDKQL